MNRTGIVAIAPDSGVPFCGLIGSQVVLSNGCVADRRKFSALKPLICASMGIDCGYAQRATKLPQPLPVWPVMPPPFSGLTKEMGFDAASKFVANVARIVDCPSTY